ncbi:hypothetical protein AGMMS50229_13550 [Campylobacterota bacterium]|nr:hypothetical protein AGMMS50229_13550 [Campylobacterota bacterium]
MQEFGSRIYLDTETTGGDSDDRLCQIAFLVETPTLIGYEKPTAHDDLCKPPKPIGFGAMSVNHITNEMVENAPSFADSRAAKTLQKLNEPQSVMIIHNAPFDLAMLEREGFIWRGYVLDTLRAARHLIESDSHALQYLRYALGLYKDEEEFSRTIKRKVRAHDAVGDTIVLYLLTQRLLEAHSMEELIALADKPVKLRTLRFGKHKDKSFDEVAHADRGYLVWLLTSERQKADIDQNKDLIYTIEAHLGS